MLLYPTTNIYQVLVGMHKSQFSLLILSLTDLTLQFQHLDTFSELVMNHIIKILQEPEVMPSVTSSLFVLGFSGNY
jgi:hypothetical protein